MTEWMNKQTYFQSSNTKYSLTGALHMVLIAEKIKTMNTIDKDISLVFQTLIIHKYLRINIIVHHHFFRQTGPSGRELQLTKT